MSVLSRVAGMFKRRGESTSAPIAGLFATPVRAAGWWRDDQVEQLRNYQSWVYAAVNAIAQEVAQQRPFLYRNTGQAEHEQIPLPAAHPLVRLLDSPNPWMTRWELWYLTVVYLELTGATGTPRRGAAPTAGGSGRRSSGSCRRRGSA